MSGIVSRTVRMALQQVGARMTDHQLRRLRSVESYLVLGRVLRTLSEQRPVSVRSRFELFALALDRVTGQAPLYLEFGVYQGESLRWWSDQLTQPGAALVGFDSFEGLPEQWWPDTPRGHFDTGGRVPDIADPRVSYQVGWFDDTLPTFALPAHDQLIVNVDADLYSSAGLVLDTLSDALVPGALIYFDELHDLDHELRAFTEHLAATGKKVVPIAIANGGKQGLFQYL